MDTLERDEPAPFGRRTMWTVEVEASEEEIMDPDNADNRLDSTLPENWLVALRKRNPENDGLYDVCWSREVATAAAAGRFRRIYPGRRMRIRPRHIDPHGGDVLFSG